MTQKQASRSKSTQRKAPAKPAASTARASSLSALKLAEQQWQTSDWAGLASRSLEKIEKVRDRGKVAALVAAANFQIERPRKGREFLDVAREFGCPESFIQTIIIHGVHNQMGKLALLAGETDRSLDHFEEAVSLFAPAEQDVRQLARRRRAREAGRLGLLMDSASELEETVDRLDKSPDFLVPSSQIQMLRTEIDLLKHELSIAMKRGQLGHSDVLDESREARLQRLATSQLGQDLWVLEKTNYKKNGFFVEFGATDGVLLSNTYLLEKEFDWQGLLAEPNSRFHKDLKENRTCRISHRCIGATTGQSVEFVLADAFGGMKSHIGNDHNASKREAYAADASNVIRLETISLNDFLIQLDAPRTIDYISIDTEGSELEILEAFPFEDWDVKLWTIEHNFVAGFREKIFDLMTRHGYQRQEVEWDDWYFKP